MLSILSIIILGVVVGYFLRHFSTIKHVAAIISVIIVLLLFFLGVSVGANEEVVKNFSSIGLDALVLTVGGTLGSVLCAWWVYTSFFKRKEKNHTSK